MHFNGISLLSHIAILHIEHMTWTNLKKEKKMYDLISSASSAPADALQAASAVAAAASSQV